MSRIKRSNKSLEIACFLAFWALPLHAAPAAPLRVVQVLVALADNDHQGIVKTSKPLGDGDSTETNLYWGAGYGVRTFFKKHAKERWEFVSSAKAPAAGILERVTFKHRQQNVELVAHAYRGREIERAIRDFFATAAGRGPHGKAALVAYVGHDGLMDFKVKDEPAAAPGEASPAIVLACISRTYFGPHLERIGAPQLLMTNGLMAPEAYTLDAAIEAWLAGGDGKKIAAAGAAAYAKYQKISKRAAAGLFKP